MAAKQLSDVVEKVLERLPAEEAPSPQADDPVRKEEARRQWVEKQLDVLMRLIGPRYQNATLDNYEAVHPVQEMAVVRLRQYATNLPEEVKAGQGVLLFGTTGTGKDHLLIGLAREAIAGGFLVRWVNGVDLHTKMREAIRAETGEDQVLKAYKDVRVLVLSDPMPPSGALTDYQAATLYRLIDYRYRHLLPVWCSLNVANANEARERLGSATVDRLRDGALAIECNWPSHRRARR